MQSNKTFSLEKQNHTPSSTSPPPPAAAAAAAAAAATTPPRPTNGQQASSQTEGLTIDLKNFRKPGEKTFTQRSRLFVGNLPPDITEEEMRKLFEKYGKAGEVFIHKDKGFGFIFLETRTLAEIAKVELDNWTTCHSVESSCACALLVMVRPLRFATFLSTCPTNCWKKPFLCLARWRGL